MVRLLSAIGLLPALISPAAAYTGGVWWPESEGGNGHYYNVVRRLNMFTWQDAVLDSMVSGFDVPSHLATLTSQAEQDFVYEHLVADPTHWNGGQGPWVGLSQHSFDNTPLLDWEWVTGEPTDYLGWARGEPNNVNGIEDYAHFWNSFVTPRNSLNDNVGDLALPYVLEFEVPTLTPIGAMRPLLPPAERLIAIEGVVTNTTDLVANSDLANLSLQDETGGTLLFGNSQRFEAIRAEVAPGRRVRVTGPLTLFNGLVEIDTESPYFTITPLDSPGVPDPTKIATADLADFSATAEALELTLVELPQVRFVLDEGQEPVFEGLTNYTVVDGEGVEAVVRVSTNQQDLVGVAIPDDWVDLTGLFSQYDVAAPAPGVAGQGYQLLLRGLADVGLTGDYNGDGAVDAADYTVWRDAAGGADAYQAWADNYGAAWSPVAPAAGIPEPGGLALVVAAARPGRRRG